MINLHHGSRPIRLLAVFLAAWFLAAACGDGGAETSEPSASSDSASASAGTTVQDAADATSSAPAETPPSEGDTPVFPVDVEHALGVTTIEAEPERIVVLSDQIDLASLLALDVQPIAAGQTLPEAQPWIAERLGPDVEVFESILISPEFIAALEPDLIIGGEFTLGQTPEIWTGIAPWVAVPQFGWEDALRIVGDATGQAAKADEVRQATMARIDAFDDDIAASAPSMSIVFAAPDGSVSVMNAENPLSDLLVGMGLPPLPDPLDGFASAGPGGDIVPAEQISLIETDAIIVADPAGQGALETLESNSLWATLPAVQDGRVTVITGVDVFLTFIDSALTIPLQVELFERLVVEFNER
ncbi:MAG: ABC transporter substrate-binding protein [Actinomycetota bacterium]